MPRKIFSVTRIRIWTKIKSDRRIGPKNTTDRRICIPLFTPLFNYTKSKFLTIATMSASGLKKQSACSSNHWNQSTTFFQDQLKRSTPGNETQQDNEWKLCTQLWQLKWSNYHPMPKQCYLNILYSLTSPWFHRTWKILHVIHKRHVHRWDQVDKKTGYLFIQKKQTWRGIRKTPIYPCNELCCISFN